MPEQSEIQQTLLNSTYSLSTLVNNNVNLILQGGVAIKTDFINWFNLNLQALTYQFAIGDFTSENTTIIYDRLNYFVGVPYGATVDNRFQNPAIIINNEPPYSPLILVRSQADLIDAGGGNWYLPFLNDAGQAIVNGSRPVSVTSNGISFTFQFDETVSPGRIYGFANNDTQTIIVTVI